MFAALRSYWKSTTTMLIMSWVWIKTQSIPILVEGLTSDIFEWIYDRIYGIPSAFKPQYLWRGNAYEEFVQARERTAWYASLLVKSILLGAVGFVLFRILRFGEGVWSNYKKANPGTEERHPRRASSPSPRRGGEVEPAAQETLGVSVYDDGGRASFSRSASIANFQQGSFSRRESINDFEQLQVGDESRPPGRGEEEEAAVQAALAGSPFQEGSDLRGSFMTGGSFAALAAVANRRAGSAPVRERPRTSSDSDLALDLPVPPLFLPENGNSQPFVPSRVSADAAPERVTGVIPRRDEPHLRRRPGEGSGIMHFPVNSSASLEASPPYTPAAAAASPLIPSFEASPSYTPASAAAASSLIPSLATSPTYTPFAASPLLPSSDASPSYTPLAAGSASPSRFGLPSFSGNVPRDLELTQAAIFRQFAKKP